MIEGGSDAQVLAAIARGRIRSKLPDVAAQALEGHFDAATRTPRGVDRAPTASSASPTAPRWPGNSRQPTRARPLRITSAQLCGLENVSVLERCARE